MNLRLGSLKGGKVETRSEFLFLKHGAATLGDTHTHRQCVPRPNANGIYFWRPGCPVRDQTTPLLLPFIQGRGGVHFRFGSTLPSGATLSNGPDQTALSTLLLSDISASPPVPLPLLLTTATDR